jgi:hypothetical protein
VRLKVPATVIDYFRCTLVTGESEPFTKFSIG